MKLTRYILRGALLLVIVFLIAYLNRKTDVSIDQVAKFKLETFNKMKSDSLDIEGKLDLLVDETNKFSGQINEESSNVRQAVSYLIVAFVLLILLEVSFFIADRRDGRQSVD